jgi:hypothetical protein
MANAPCGSAGATVNNANRLVTTDRPRQLVCAFGKAPLPCNNVFPLARDGCAP